jgi:hypothetical protein
MRYLPKPTWLFFNVSRFSLAEKVPFAFRPSGKVRSPLYKLRGWTYTRTYTPASLTFALFPACFYSLDSAGSVLPLRLPCALGSTTPGRLAFLVDCCSCWPSDVVSRCHAVDDSGSFTMYSLESDIRR